MVQMSRTTMVLGFLQLAHIGPHASAMTLLDVRKPGDRAVATQKAASCDGSALTASVVRPGDATYDASRSQFGSVMASSTVADARLQPAMIILASSDADVQEAVSFAQSCSFQITVRSGGHNYAAISSCPAGSSQCIQVDLRGIQTLSLDTAVIPNLATIGSGLRVEEVNAYMLPRGVTVVSGTCNKVGVGGHFQTSAASYLSRAFGLGIDLVTSMRVVSADAQVHVVTESSDPDWYWALLGGSPGGLGIVLDYTVETRANSDYPHAASFTYVYPYSRAMLHATGSLFSTLTNDPANDRDMLYLYMVHPGVLFGFPGSTYEHYIMIRGVWSGADSGALSGANLDKYVKPFDDIPHITLSPVTTIPLSAMQAALGSDFNMGPYRYHIAGLGLKEVPDSAWWELAADECDTRIAIPNYHFSLQFWSWGTPGGIGAASGRNAYSPSLRTAKVWVDDWNFFYGDSLATVAEERIEAFRNATGHIWDEDNIAHSYMTPDTRTTNNYNSAADFSMTAGWFDRIQDVKTRVDPTDIFHSGLTIPPRQSSASAVGDPHLQNIHGERFDVMQPGRHTLLEIPRRSRSEGSLLLVEAEAQYDGSACADIYFQELNITGAWAEPMNTDGLRFSARDDAAPSSQWMTFGTVDLKVTHGHTQQGTRYLNFFSKRLGHSGFSVGGLLGEDDHQQAATPLKQCMKSLALLQGGSGQTADTSRAEASLE